jgi:hypothetical protein
MYNIIDDAVDDTIAELLQIPLAEAFELQCTVRLYNAAWKLCPEKAPNAAVILKAFQKRYSARQLSVQYISMLGDDGCVYPSIPDEGQKWNFRYHYAYTGRQLLVGSLTRRYTLVRDRKLNLWGIADPDTLKV